MLNKNEQQQQGGDYSVNNQANTINNYGLSVNEVREIALGVFKENSLVFSQIAKDVADERAERITNKFLLKLYETNPNLLNRLVDPSIQLALYSLQKAYVKDGDESTADLLINILLERTEIEGKSLQQIVLDESLLAIPKLTNAQIDALSLIFLIRIHYFNNINSIAGLNSYLNEYYKPLCNNLTREPLFYLHIQYANCGFISTEIVNIESTFKKKYNHLFKKGFTWNEHRKDLYSLWPQYDNGEIDWDNHMSKIVIPSYQDESKLQISPMNGRELEEVMKRHFFNVKERDQGYSLATKYDMSDYETSQYLISKGEFMSKLFDVYNNSLMKNMDITSVGIAIALFNISVKTGRRKNLSNWIK